MTDDNLDQNAAAQATPLQCFEASRAGSLADTLYVAFVALTMIPLLVVASVLLVFHEMECSLLPGILIVCAVTLLGLWMVWRGAVSKFRFCVIFHPDCLQIGRSFAKCTFPYDEVEVIAVSTARTQGSFIKIKCNSRNVKVHLSAQDLPDCLALLQKYCVNAIILDDKGRAHLPQYPTSFTRPVNALQCTFGRRALWCSLFCILFTGICILNIVHLVSWRNGNLQLDNIAVARAYGVVLLFGIMGNITFGAAFQYCRVWMRIRRGRAVIAASRNSTDSNDDSQSQ
jgi:hypothetical protein